MARHPAGKGLASVQRKGEGEGEASRPLRPVQRSVQGVPTPPEGVNRSPRPVRRPETSEREHGKRKDPARSLYRVRTGDSLWSIAADATGSWDASRILALTSLIHSLNRAVIGPDPDLIFPGQVLELPADLVR